MLHELGLKNVLNFQGFPGSRNIFFMLNLVLIPFLSPKVLDPLVLDFEVLPLLGLLQKWTLMADAEEKEPKLLSLVDIIVNIFTENNLVVDP